MGVCVIGVAQSIGYGIPFWVMEAGDSGSVIMKWSRDALPILPEQIGQYKRQKPAPQYMGTWEDRASPESTQEFADLSRTGRKTSTKRRDPAE